ncbi:ABC transporter permease [Streptacidiphilus jiangxiensis]|uniref:Osmoprotectant transport system permease protein n=1 Tax=Streptacidiphilus jiangxiensis TaxID=235985 RepID=A0A1H7JZ79_STRJI|nr:ABC transporter permease subunit [Streptacidiphilus jiangxiensis]SEK79576.1 osmoprotectant transport system permease protein [Streptacidiphilus jiangxiensis]
MNHGGFFEVPSDLQNTWWGLVGWQCELALLPVLYGLILALPLGMLCARFRWIYPPVLGVATVFYAIPSLAFFVFLIDYYGESDITVEIPLTVYSLVVLIPAIVDGMRSVSEDTRAAATAMGFGTLRRYLQVELPIAVPAVIAGLRVATVSSVSLVSVGMLIGNEGALGNLLSDALSYHRPLLAWDAVLSIAVIGVVLDALLVLARRLLTPWARKATAK